MYIMQRDYPMASPIPRLTSYEDVEVMVVARPVRGAEGIASRNCRQRPQEHYLYRSNAQGQGSASRTRPRACTGTLALSAKMKSLQSHLKDGLVTSNSYPDMTPRSFDDVLSGDIMEWLSVYARDQATMALVASAFPGSIEEESVPLEEVDTVEGEQDGAMMDVSEDAIQQETELDEVDIPNLPIKEAERRAGLRRLPQKVRIAIRRLHRQFCCPSRKPNVEQDCEGYLRKYVSQLGGYIGSFAMFHKRFC